MDNRNALSTQWSQLLEKIRDINFAMLTTENEDGTLHSRPMATQEATSEGSLWFFTGRSSQKIKDIEGCSQVNLAYVAGDRNTFISVAGEAYWVDDKSKAKELWSPILKAWFPGGLEDPDLILLRVDVESVEYWDLASKKMETLIRFVKALAGKGDPEESTGHGTIRPPRDL